MTIKAVLLDLDGTLLPHDYDVFEKRLFGAYAKYFAVKLPGVDIMGPLMPALMKLLANDGTRTNEDLFWDVFAPQRGLGRDELRPLFVEFYATEFPKLRGDIGTDPVARVVVDALKGRGLKVALATNSVYPIDAVGERLRWSGLDASAFDRIACIEAQHFCKPHSGYYVELASMLGVSPQECLMVGNDIEMDIKPAAKIGMRTVLVENPFQVWQDKSARPDHVVQLADVPALV